MANIKTVAWLSPYAVQFIDELCLKESASRSEIIRRAVNQYISGKPLFSESDYRRLYSAEYAAAALTLLLKKDHPEIVQQAIDLARQRTESLHVD